MGTDCRDSSDKPPAEERSLYLARSSQLRPVSAQASGHAAQRLEAPLWATPAGTRMQMSQDFGTCEWPPAQ